MTEATMTYDASVAPIKTVRLINQRAQQPNAELIALLISAKPISPAQWEWIRQFEMRTAG